MLEGEYQRNSNWNTEQISRLAKRLSLPRTKVYKWSWDRRKKEFASTLNSTAGASSSIMKPEAENVNEVPQQEMPDKGPTLLRLHFHEQMEELERKLAA